MLALPQTASELSILAFVSGFARLQSGLQKLQNRCLRRGEIDSLFFELFLRIRFEAVDGVPV